MKTPSSSFCRSRHSRRWWIALAACFVLAVGATGAAVAGKGKGHHHDAGDMGERIASHLEDRLDLNQTQETQVAAIITEGLERHRALRENSPLHSAWGQDSLDADTLRQVLEARQSPQAKAARRAAQIALRANVLADIHAVLTPEQRQQALPMLVRYLSYGMDGHGMHHGGHHGKHHRRGHYD